MTDTIDIYFKDLKVAVQRKIKEFYKKFKITGLGVIYDSTEPILVLMAYDDGEEPEINHMDEMVS